MEKKIHSFIVIFLLSLNALFAREFYGNEAQQKIKGAEKIITGDVGDVPEYIQFRNESQVSFADFNSWAHKAFALSSSYDFVLLNSLTDDLGMTHYRFQQTFNGTLVEGAMFIVHVKNGRIVSMNGNLFNKLNVAASPSIDKALALNKALSYMNASLYRWQISQMEKQLKEQTNNPAATWFPKGELMVAPVNGNLSDGSYRLSYRFDVFAEKPLRREYVFVDAVTGEVIYHQNRIHDAAAVGTAITAYSGSRTINTDSVNATTFRLREYTRGNGIETYNLQRGTTYTNTDFTDADNMWNNVNAQQDQYATDAHWGGEMTYDFYKVKFNRNSIDNANLKLVSYVHYSTGYLNAFWDGTEMTYGDGSTGYTPLTSLDITGHEITHGFTQYTSNLGGSGSGEPGALNEGFSDCFGASIRYYGKQATSVDWIMGDEIGGAPFRSMSDPNSTGNPDTYLGTYWDAAQEVHANSTVLSHCYYLLSEGGSGTNDNGDAYNVVSLGIAKAQQIWYRMNAVYLTSNSGYANARTYAIQAAIDIYGPCTNEVVQTANAWHAVGVGNAFTPGVTADFTALVTSFCSFPATVNFVNNSSNGGSYIWDFGDGYTSTASNPTHVYNSYGNYNVSLIANGGTCGIDTTIKVQYISVQSTNPCIVSLPNSGIGSTQTACAGQLYDNGGPSANYTDQTDVSITIAPTGASLVTLTFTSFDFESNYDYLYIYDGPNTSSPLIGQYTGATLPNGGIIASTGSSITVRQTSDVNLNYSGFALGWQCTFATSPPVANFNASATTTCTGTIQFADLSTNGPTSWHWAFGDGVTSAQQSPVHTYTASGTYTVVLIATNSYGSDTLIMSNYIHINLPLSPTTTSATICSGASATLSANGSSVLSWFTTPTGGTLVDTGSVFHTPALTSTTTYYVESDISGPPVNVGPVDNTISAGGNYTGTTYRYLTFDCFSATTLLSVKVYSAQAGYRSITLIQNGITLDSIYVNIPNGTSRVNLNFPIPVGTQFELGVQGVPNLFRNNMGANFPYTLNGVLSITGSSVGSNYYYYFYDWQVQGPPCTSSRVPVTANVSTPNPSFTSTVNSNLGSFTCSSSGVTSYHWVFGDPASGANNISSLQNPTHVFSSSGAYVVCLTVTNSTGCTNLTCNTVLVSSVGIAEITKDNGISVFPNPAADEIFITFDDNLSGKKMTLQLADVLGNIISEKIITATTGNKNKSTMDISSFAAGTYILILQSDEERFVRRIIKE